MSATKLLAFRPYRPPRRIRERFADDRLLLARAWRTSGEFREVCRDYREACASLARLGADGKKAEGGRTRSQLEELVAELEGEIEALLRVEARAR